MTRKDTARQQTFAGLVAAVVLALAGLVAWKWKQGREPRRPTQLSWKDWKRVLVETKNALGKKKLPILAAGVAYFSTLAFFPMLAAAVAIAAFVITPDQLQSITHNIETYLPADMASLVTTQLQHLVDKKAGTIIAAVIAIVISLYGASGAISNLITATNAAYSCRESRNFFKLHAFSLLLTLGAIALSFVIAVLLALSGATLSFLHLPALLVDVILALRWAVLVVIVAFALAVFYRYGPDRKNPKWQWVSWGALLATVIWLLGTIVFFIYVQHFGNFSNSYSLFAGIIVLMIWLNLSAFIVLLGATVNHHLELQGTDTTVDD